MTPTNNTPSAPSTGLGSTASLGAVILFVDRQPPNDYDYPCVIVFDDGYETRSDGGSVHDACVKSKIAVGWREYLPNVQDQPDGGLAR